MRCRTILFAYILIATQIVFADPKPPSASFSICTELVTRIASSSNRKADALLLANKVQEAIWELRRNGNFERAQKIEDSLAHALRNQPYTSTFLFQEFEKAGLELNASTENLLLITLQSGIKAIAKHKNGDFENPNGPRSEIAAYLVSRAFGLNNVPITIERKIHGKIMSLQYYIQDLPNGWSRPHRYHPESWFFDYLIAYSDMISSRTLNKADNYLLDPEGRQILIDNASAFNTRENLSPQDSLKDQWKTLIWGLKKMNLKLVDIVPSSEVFNRIQNVSSDEIRTQLNGKLPKQEIENLILRRDYYVKRMKPLVGRLKNQP